MNIVRFAAAEVMRDQNIDYGYALPTIDERNLLTL